jgi:hypothetical protein
MHDFTSCKPCCVDWTSESVIDCLNSGFPKKKKYDFGKLCFIYIYVY